MDVETFKGALQTCIEYILWHDQRVRRVDVVPTSRPSRQQALVRVHGTSMARPRVYMVTLSPDTGDGLERLRQVVHACVTENGAWARHAHTPGGRGGK